MRKIFDLILIAPIVLQFTVLYANQIEFKNWIYDDSANVNGLDGAKCVIISNDDRFIYIAGENDSSICWFERTETGKLSFAGRVKNDSDNVSGLKYVYDMAFGNNGKFVYAVTYYSNTLVWFSRNPETGKLSFSGKLTHGTDGVSGLNIPIRIVTSPSGKHLYTVSFNESAIGLFSVDSLTGAPVFKKVYKNGIGGFDGLSGVYDICILKDNKFAYAVSTRDSAVVICTTDMSSGELTFAGVQKYKDTRWETFKHPTRILSSADGKYIYIGSRGGGRISWFEKNSLNGQLSFCGEVMNDNGGTKGLYYLSDIKLFDRNTKLLITGYEGITLFEINNKGELLFIENKSGFDGSSITFTSNYDELFVSGFGGILLVANYKPTTAIKSNKKRSEYRMSYLAPLSVNLLGQKNSEFQSKCNTTSVKRTAKGKKKYFLSVTTSKN
jgi:6-phosphogluconolactonase (cycloisomerase 2 family)